nr:hypothetical protein [Tanacetum cinerariifolium]
VVEHAEVEAVVEARRLLPAQHVVLEVGRAVARDGRLAGAQRLQVADNGDVFHELLARYAPAQRHGREVAKRPVITKLRRAVAPQAGRHQVLLFVVVLGAGEVRKQQVLRGHGNVVLVGGRVVPVKQIRPVVGQLRVFLLRAVFLGALGRVAQNGAEIMVAEAVVVVQHALKEVARVKRLVVARAAQGPLIGGVVPGHDRAGRVK